MNYYFLGICLNPYSLVNGSEFRAMNASGIEKHFRRKGLLDDHLETIFDTALAAEFGPPAFLRYEDDNTVKGIRMQTFSKKTLPSMIENGKALSSKVFRGSQILGLINLKLATLAFRNGLYTLGDFPERQEVLIDLKTLNKHPNEVIAACNSIIKNHKAGLPNGVDFEKNPIGYDFMEDIRTAFEIPPIRPLPPTRSLRKPGHKIS